jgi:BRCA1-associated protein
MPSYFYHLKFELYPTPTPTADAHSSDLHRRDIWLPSSEADIFGVLPVHDRTDEEPPIPRHRIRIEERQPIAGPSISRALASLPSRTDPNVIDCGTPRAPGKRTGGRIERISEREWLERTNSFPPPSSNAALKPQTAASDWRFGRVRIETVDGSMAGEPSRTAASAAPSLGPMLGDAGTTNKAECLPLRTKNTEVGWGVVHFYREGDETPALDALDEDALDEGGAAQGARPSAVDCTTVCIPAVPAYMTPGDFLGFVGERWQEDISHCRMVLTSKMNRYLALLKFRDSKRAIAWRKEFDGKVFNTMEVCLSSGEGRIKEQLLTAPSLKSATSCLSGRSRSRRQHSQGSTYRQRAPPLLSSAR